MRDFYASVVGWTSGECDMGEQGRYCVIRDPAGAVLALFTPKT